MKLKCVVIGGLVFFVVMQLISFVTGPLIHEGVLDPLYESREEVWRPELREDPPNMAALMPMWLLNGVIYSLVIAGLYCCCKCGDGPGWKRGARFGLGLGVFVCALYLVWSGVFYLPSKIWIFWGVEGLISFVICGAAMGWAVGRWCSD